MKKKINKTSFAPNLFTAQFKRKEMQRLLSIP